MSYGFVYDSKKTEESEKGTEYGRKNDLIILTFFFAVFVVAILVRVIVFPHISLSGFMNETPSGNTVADETEESQIGFDVVDHSEGMQWQVLEVLDISKVNQVSDSDINASEVNEAVVKESDAKAFGELVITLPEGEETGDIAIKNYYRDRAFTVSLSDVSKSAIQNIGIYADDISEVISAAVKNGENGLQISVTMNGLYEYETEVTDGRLKVYYYVPSDIYDTVVVIDPNPEVYQTDTGDNDITALVAEEVENLAASKNIKVYVTRDGNETRSEAERFALMVDANPDLVIQLGESDSTDISEYGLNAYYNGDFYMPDMNNASIAEILLRNTAIETSNRAEAIKEAGGDSLLMLLETPSAGLNIGYVSNETECALLNNSEYRIKIAEGIIAALQEIFNKN